MIDSQDLEAQAEQLLKNRQPRRRDAPRLASALEHVRRHDIPTPHGAVAAWRLGGGPAVLFVHGWDDDNSLWAPAIETYAAAGRSVVVLDLPGHGFSAAPEAHYRVAATAINAVAEALGPIEALVTHSYGGAVSVAAIEAGLPVRRIVLIAATIPRRMKGGDPEVLPPGARAVHDRAAALYEARTGLPMALYDVEAAAPRMSAQALFLHSADDEYPAANAEHLARLWPGARFELTDGLGHRRIARDRATLERTLRFMEEGR